MLLNGEKIQKLVDPSNGAALEAYSLEPELITNLVGDDREKRRLVQFNEIPRVLVNAVVSAEDKRFFDHMGFDPLRVTKAAYVDLKEGRKEQGASTITMQLARGIWLEPEKRWKRKATELMISMILEQQLYEESDLRLLRQSGVSGRRDTFSIHGFGEAARVYFDRDISRLTLPQAALLAGLIQRPELGKPVPLPRSCDRPQEHGVAPHAPERLHQCRRVCDGH